MDRQYQGYFYLAQSARSPEVVSNYLEEYLISLEDVHGYAALIWENPSTDTNHLKEIIKSFEDRADDLSEKKKFADQRIDVQLSFRELTNDMENKKLLMAW